jgi:hypothetical protein
MGNYELRVERDQEAYELAVYEQEVAMRRKAMTKSDAQIIERTTAQAPEWVEYIRDYAGDNDGFIVYCLRVDFHVKRVAGFSFLDLEDFAVRDAYDNEVPARETAAEILEAAGVF